MSRLDIHFVSYGLARLDAQFLADLRQLGADTILEKDDVSLVNEQIGTHVHEAYLAGDVTPSMNAGADALGPRLGENGFGGFEKDRIMRSLDFCNISAEHLKKMNEFIDYVERIDTDKTAREFLQDLHDEDSLHDDGLM